MANPELTERMKDFFQRQIACFEAMRRDLEAMPIEAEDAQLEQLVRRQEAFAQQNQDMEREFRRLWVEWEAATNLSEAERSSVRASAQSAGRLANELAVLQDQNGKRVDARLAKVRAEMGELRRGRDLMGKYGPRGDSGPAAFFDRHA